MHIRSHAPVRTADLGGWSDTWFATTGKVCNVAVEPGITVDVRLDRASNGYQRVNLTIGTQRSTFALHPSDERDAPVAVPGPDPLILAAIRRVPPSGNVDITIRSGVPAGSGLGTSASVAVALLAALHALRGESVGPEELASEAHGVETSLGLQSGVQDQLGAAFGGAHLFDIAYPRLVTPPMPVDAEALALLDASLVTVYLGQPHRSSELHEKVIASLENRDNEHLLGPLRHAALDGFAALCAGDLDGFGLAMQRNHEAQKALHPALVSATADRAIEAARACGARGWKVNGAGGEGGSLCLLAPVGSAAKQKMAAAVSAVAGVSVLDLRVTAVGVTTSSSTDA